MIENAKCSRPSVCNAAETLLVHASVANVALPEIARRLSSRAVELRCDPRAKALMPDSIEATEEDWSTEYNDLILSVKVVDSFDEAVKHIETYGTHHSDAIITSRYDVAERFLNEVNSAAVYVNASTRFTDGEEFGFGAEIGISTQKLHARGPMGLDELTTTGHSRLWEISRGDVHEHDIDPRDIGIPLADIDDLLGADPWDWRAYAVGLLVLRPFALRRRRLG